MDPGGHGIYDFVHRDPQTYHPISSATPPAGDLGTSVKLFGYQIPVIAGDEIINNRSGVPWWDLLHTAGVDVEVYRIPGNYPPTPSEAKTLSGMGTVDMRGGYGVYTWFTDKAPTPEPGHEIKGDVQLVSVDDFDLDGIGDTVSASLKGAPDIFHLAPGQIPGENDYLTVPIKVWIDAESEVALIRAGDAEAVVKEGEWTEWLPLSFEALGAGAMPLAGSVRFYAKELRPGFALYASPVNITAADPAQPISTPDEFSPELAEILGDFYTQGMPEETNALKDGTFNDDDYISQVALVQEDAEAMLKLALSRFSPGDATFFYLSDIDLQCHMLWRHQDPKYPDAPHHPAWNEASAAKHALAIEGYYRNVDKLLGQVMQELPEKSLLLVISDHGFQPFTRKVHLNSWLRDHGWLTLKDGKRTGKLVLDEVDWSKTRAYAVGFNALYLNVQGRESQGIVPAGDVDAVAAALQSELKGLTDPKNGASVILRVDRGNTIYHGARVQDAPDLVVGYDKGYGHSDESTLGEILEPILEDNTSRWSGNHLMAPEVVPGVLLSNQALAGTGHNLTDVTATLLAWYGLTPLPEMQGKSFLNP
jgi:predicted AlkP superfamily phosphohydrolase/phosphomutase